MKLFCKILIMWVVVVNSCFAALDFDGVDDYVNISGVGLGKTVAVWARIDTCSEQRIIEQTVGTYRQGLGVNASSEMGGSVYDGTDYNKRGKACSTGIHHFVMISDGSARSTLKVYIDGNEETLSLQTFGLSSVASTMIGTRTIANNFWFSGMVNDIRFYDRILSTREIQELYNSNLKRSSIIDGLVGYWPLDECPEGQVCNDTDLYLDLSGNGNHGTGSGADGPIGRQETILSYP